MRFSTLILKNLLNRPTRSLLTVVGLAIGIAAVVALMGIAAGFERSFLSLYSSKGIDLVVVRGGISNQLSSTLEQQLGDRLARFPGVRRVGRSLVDTVAFEDKNLVSVLINGWERDSLMMEGIRVVEGRVLQPGDDRSAMLGRVLARNLDKKPGDMLDVAGEPFLVIGTFESPSLFENGGLIIPLPTLQRMMGRQGQVTAFLLATAAPENSAAITALGHEIEAAVPGVAAVPARDFVERDLQIRLARAMAWSTSLIALVVGSIGILNTMVAAVYERTGEIGVLRAIGWTRRRVLRLILGESLALGLMGSIVGVLLALVGVRLILLAPTARSFIDPNLDATSLLMGLALGLALSLVGGLYPALRAARLEPTEALRYE
ncbi:ABC transporter permease [Isosphaeraceae bacterium EP7]